MRVQDVMTPNVKLTSPDQTIKDAACMMAEIDAGILPVAQGDRLVGMITDRDIAVRAVARDLPPSTPIEQVMSREVLYCYDDDDTDDVAENMSQIQVRRLPVLNRDKRLVGIVSIADLAVKDGPECAGEAVSGISEPGGQHSQKSDGRAAAA
jgi:CBS domain-containing protein